jgi:hypothetical protein
MVVAVVLLLAQFPAAFNWARWIARWRLPVLAKGRVHQYQRVGVGVGVEEYEMEDFHHVESRGCADGGLGSRSELRSGTSLKKRKTKGKAAHLRVDTAGEYYWLGIAVPGDQFIGRQELREDDELGHRLKSPMTARSAYLTAPLPSAVSSSRAGWTPTKRSPTKSPLSTVVSSPDIERGDMQPSPLSVPSPNLFDINSPLHEALRSPEYESPPKSAFLARVNDDVRDAADRLSKTFYVQVTAPEEGLLLSVREDEREKALVSGVFVA